MSLFHARLSHSLFHAAVNLTQGPRSFQALVFKVKGLNNALVSALVHTLIMTAQVWFQSWRKAPLLLGMSNMNARMTKMRHKMFLFWPRHTSFGLVGWLCMLRLFTAYVLIGFILSEDSHDWLNLEVWGCVLSEEQRQWLIGKWIILCSYYPSSRLKRDITVNSIRKPTGRPGSWILYAPRDISV